MRYSKLMWKDNKVSNSNYRLIHVTVLIINWKSFICEEWKVYTGSYEQSKALKLVPRFQGSYGNYSECLQLCTKLNMQIKFLWQWLARVITYMYIFWNWEFN